MVRISAQGVFFLLKHQYQLLTLFLPGQFQGCLAMAIPGMDISAAIDQDGQRPNGISLNRKMQHRLVCAGGRMDICSVAEQELCTFYLVFLYGHVQGGKAGSRPVINIYPFVNQDLGTVDLATLGSDMQERYPSLQLTEGNSSLFHRIKQQLHACGITTADSVAYGRVVFVIQGTDIGIVVDQNLHTLPVIAHGGQVQGSLATYILEVDIRFVSQKKLDTSQLAQLCG